MGLVTQMQVDGKFGVGDLATGLGDKVRVTVSVLGPSWVSAECVELFAHGVKLRERTLRGARHAGHKAKVTWAISRPAHDVWLVAFASGPPVTAPFWAIPRPYQPSSRAWHPRVLACTNPIWLDADGDGKFTSPRGYARQLVERAARDPARLLSLLAEFDEATAAQAASLWQAGGHDLRDDRVQRSLEGAAPAANRGIAAFLATAPLR
jgi:hypothetical protein